MVFGAVKEDKALSAKCQEQRAVNADGASMNRAEVGGRKIEDGDFVIIDSRDKDVVSGNVVLAVIDDRATIKRFIHDRANHQIVLIADSCFDYAPVYLRSNDDSVVRL